MLAFLLFFLSGVAALVLEIVFLRQLAWLFGNAATATALVLAAFMAGLAAGSAGLGRVADRVARPLRLFGAIEIGVGLSGAALAWLLGEGREVFLGPLRALPPGATARGAEFLLAFVLLCVPTVLMGGSLPALCRYATRDPERLIAPIGLLYGLNTLGGAAGVYLAGFHLFERVGVSRSAFLAAALDVAVGLVAIALDRGRVDAAGRADRAHAPAQGEGRRRHALAPDRPRPPAPPPGSAPRTVSRPLCLLAVALGGGVVLGYEVVWTRLLALPMRSFSYSFSLMLALFLCGLVLGALAVAALAERIRRPLLWFAGCELLMAVYVTGSLLWLPDALAPAGARSFAEFLTRSALGAMPVVLPPTVLSGMALLLAMRALEPDAERIAREVGIVYAANTLGAIFGALCAGLWLLPQLGAPRSLALLAAINALAGLLVLPAVRPRRPAWIAAGVLALVAPAAALAMPGERFVRAFLGAVRDRDTLGELLFYREGATDTVAIVRREYGFHDPGAKSLITNGISMSASVKPVWRYMALEGHLPVLLARGSERALVIGVGTGITLGAVASHPGLGTIDAVELSDGVVAGLAHFEAESAGALADPRVRLIREDGRHFLALSRERYDVITLEPPPPIVAGSVHLYSLDFYRLCARRLREGGVVAQWLPLHAQSLASARMAAATFVEAFPHVQLWLPSIRDAVLVGSLQPLELTVETLRRSYAEPRTRANLEEAYLESPAALLATLLLDRTGVERWVAGAPLVTDEHPRMEFFRKQGANMRDAEIGGLLEPPQAGWSWIDGLDDDPALRDAVFRENRALRSYLRSKVERDGNAALEAARLSTATEFFLYGFGCTTRQRRDARGLLPADAARSHEASCERLLAERSPS